MPRDPSAAGRASVRARLAQIKAKLPPDVPDVEAERIARAILRDHLSTISRLGVEARLGRRHDVAD